MSSLEAKIVVLGSQGVGKTSLVTRFCKGAFNPSQITSTVGASFLTKRVVDTDTDTVVRLQIWDTAGQERFRSISRLYYRGANACILCYSITDAQSFAEMGVWLTELRRNLPADIVLHVVGTKSDIVARDPSKREVPFERCIAYVAENLAPGLGSTPPPTAQHTPGATAAMMMGMGGSYFFSGGRGESGAGGGGGGGGSGANAIHSGPGGGGGGPSGAAFGGGGAGDGRSSNGVLSSHNNPHQSSVAALQQSTEPKSPSSKRSSGFWGQEVGWDACHEISAESGEGVEEVFRVVTRKLVEQNRKMQQALLAATATPGGEYTPGGFGGGGMLDGSGGPGGGSGGAGHGGYFDGANPRGSFRVGRDRRSWLFSPGFSPAVTTTNEEEPGGEGGQDGVGGRRKRGCC